MIGQTAAYHAMTSDRAWADRGSSEMTTPVHREPVVWRDGY